MDPLALQESGAAGDGGGAGTVGQQRGGQLGLGSMVVAQGESAFWASTPSSLTPAGGADGLRETERAERPEQRVDGDVEQRAAAVAGCAHSREVGEYGAGKPRSAPTHLTSPISPDAAISKALCMLGRKRLHMASIRNSPLARASGHKFTGLPGRSP